MDVKPGYKLTELGVIPKDWGVSPLGRLSEFVTSGSRGWAAHYSDQGPLFVRSQNIRNGSLDFTDRQCVMPPTGSEGSRTRLNCSDLLITITGNSVGNVAWVEQDLGEAYISQHVGLVRLLDPSLAEYICLFLAPSSPGNRQIAGSQSGQSKPGLNLRNLEDFLVALPSRPEQRAIATALSDVDALLGGLDRLIAKKRDLKQAAMQQLLTGQTRLPGFHGEWEVKTLGDLGSTYGGLTGKSKADFGVGTGRYVTFMNVMTNVVIDCSSFERVRVMPSEAQNRVRRNDVLFNGSSETPEEVAMCASVTADVPDLFLNSFCFGFRFRDDAEADSVFLAYYLRSREGRELLKSLAQGSTRYNLSKVAFLKAPLRLPSLAEQTAITAVLMDIDANLVALEARRNKTHNLKQAMMQELLTGKTRLVQTGAAHA